MPAKPAPTSLSEQANSASRGSSLPGRNPHGDALPPQSAPAELAGSAPAPGMELGMALGVNDSDSGTKYPATGTIKSPVLVLDAAGGVGRGVVEALLASDRPVIAVSPDGAMLAALRDLADARRLSLLPGSVATEAEALALVAALRQLRRPPRQVVAHLPASRERCRLLDCSEAFLRAEIETHLLPHFVAARHLLPLLGEEGGGSYLIVDGPGAGFPWAGYAHRSVASAAVRMLALALHNEAHAHHVRLRLLSLGTPVREADADCDCPEWPTAVEVGRRAATVLQGRDDPSPEIRLASVDRRPASPFFLPSNQG